jgi:gas vesicle protein
MYFYQVIFKNSIMKNSTKILAAAAMGVIAGSVVGLLFAPDKGDETRKKIAKQSDKMLKQIKDGFGKERIAKLKGKLENKLQKVNAKLEEFSKEDPKQA